VIMSAPHPGRVSAASAVMSFASRSSAIVLAAGVALAVGVRGDETKPSTAPACAAAVDDFFTDEVWAKVGAPVCLTCHKTGGDAEDSKFILQDPQRVQGATRDVTLRHNRDAF